MAAVRVHGYPATLAAQAEAARERTRDQRGVEQPAGVEDVGHAAGAVVAAGPPGGVPAAPDVGLALDLVAGANGSLHWAGSARRSVRQAERVDGGGRARGVGGLGLGGNAAVRRGEGGRSE